MTPRQRLGLAASLTAALALRVLVVLSLAGDPYFYEPIVDAAAYDAWAADIAARSFWGDRAFYQDPLYPYGLGIFYAIFGRDLLWARIVQCAIATGGLWMLFEAVRRFLGYRTAIVALLLGAFYKTFAFFDAMLLKDFLGVVAVEAALFFWSLDNNKWKWAAFGAALGAGTLVRGNLLLLALAAAVFLAARRAWRPAALVLAGAAALVLPVTVRNAAVAGDFVLTTAQLGPNLYTGNNPENTTGRYRPPSFLAAGSAEFEEPGFRQEAERLTGRPLKASEVDAYWRGRAVDYVFQNFGTFLVVTGKRVLMLLSAYEIPDDHDPAFMSRFSWVLRLPLFTFGLFLAPLAAVGIYLSTVERGRFAMLYVLAGAYALSIIFFFVFARYRLPLVPFLLVFAAHGVVKAAQIIEWRMMRLPKIAGGIFLATAVLVNLPLPAAAVGHRDFRAQHYNLGLYYARHDRHRDAAEEFEAAARLNPEYLKDPVYVWTLADAHERSGNPGRAFEHYERVVALDPRAPGPPYKVGTLYLANEMWERAAGKFVEALRRDPTFGAAYVPLAEANRRLGRHDVALKNLEIGSAAVPRDWSIRLKKAEIYRELGMWKEAQGAAEEALQIKPGEPDALRIRDEARRRR